mmetsp:Transcript_44035/g.102797  ORF Transcript_44035/g.102797 Transcript_44035/m.102797 type:complete len:242 (-) Transcript_44035:560-1285(-)
MPRPCSVEGLGNIIHGLLHWRDRDEAEGVRFQGVPAWSRLVLELVRHHLCRFGHRGPKLDLFQHGPGCQFWMQGPTGEFINGGLGSRNFGVAQDAEAGSLGPNRSIAEVQDFPGAEVDDPRGLYRPSRAVLGCRVVGRMHVPPGRHLSDPLFGVRRVHRCPLSNVYGFSLLYGWLCGVRWYASARKAAKTERPDFHVCIHSAVLVRYNWNFQLNHGCLHRQCDRWQHEKKTAAIGPECSKN